MAAFRSPLNGTSQLSQSEVATIAYFDEVRKSITSLYSQADAQSTLPQHDRWLAAPRKPGLAPSAQTTELILAKLCQKHTQVSELFGRLEAAQKPGLVCNLEKAPAEMDVWSGSSDNNDEAIAHVIWGDVSGSEASDSETEDEKDDSAPSDHMTLWKKSAVFRQQRSTIQDDVVFRCTSLRNPLSNSELLVEDPCQSLKLLNGPSLCSQKVCTGKPVVSSFTTTNTVSLRSSLEWAMKHWHLPQSRDACCPWHGAVAVAKMVLENSATSECCPLWSPLLGWQCNECTCLNHSGKSKCDMCQSPCTDGVQRSTSRVTQRRLRAQQQAHMTTPKRWCTLNIASADVPSSEDPFTTTSLGPSLEWVMRHWNCPRIERSCCPFHAAVQMARALVKYELASPCEPSWSPLIGWQCGHCSSVNHSSVYRCDMCFESWQHAGPASEL